MDQKTYDSYPEKIKVREFKVHGIIYVTTLICHKSYSKKELAKLYQLRWQVEINLRSVKTVLNMEHLTSKTPEMVKKEVAAHFIGYNIIRTIIAEACSKHGEIPNQISFKGALQLLNQFMPYLSRAQKSCHVNMYHELLKKIVLNKIGNRPKRIEPRAVKRRRKPFPLLKNSRQLEREKLLRKVRV